VHRSLATAVAEFLEETKLTKKPKTLAAYTTALQHLRSAPSASIAPVGGARYQAGVVNADASTRAYGGRQALDLSQIDAAERQREGEGYARADLGSKLKTLGDQGDTDLYLAKLKAAREQPNPWLNLLAQLGQRVGRNYLFKNERIGAGPHNTPTTNYGAPQTTLDDAYGQVVDPSMGGR